VNRGRNTYQSTGRPKLRGGKAEKKFPANFPVTGKVARETFSGKKTPAGDGQSRPTQPTNQQTKKLGDRDKIW